MLADDVSADNTPQRPRAWEMLGDPLGEEAIRTAFNSEAVGLRRNENDKNREPDFTDAVLVHSVVRYFAGIYAHERFYAFLSHAYLVLSDAQLEHFLADVIAVHVDPIRSTANRITAVRKLVAIQAHRSDDWANRTFNIQELVVFQNGVLELPSLILRPGRPDDYMTMSLACKWHPDAPAGLIDAFLDLLLQPDEVVPFLEFVGYAMVPGAASQEKFVILLGAGENGKSRLLGILHALFDGFAASIPFQDLAKNRFEKSNLFGRLVNLVGDMSPAVVGDTSVLKTLTGGDTIHADIKFKTPIEFVNRAKSIVATNELFRVNDASWGFYRRAMIVRFVRDFRAGGKDGALRDPNVVETLLADPHTLPRLAFLAIQAYLQLRQEGRFAESDAMVLARSQFQLANDPVAAFVAEVLVEQPSADISKDTLYRAFVLWAKATGREGMNSAKFWSRWATTKPDYADSVRANVDGNRLYVMRNVAIDPHCQVMVARREGDHVALLTALQDPTDAWRTEGRSGFGPTGVRDQSGR